MAPAKKEYLVPFDEFCGMCGYFKISATHFYECLHPDCDDCEEDEDGEYRRCFTFSCPLAATAELEDMKRLDPEWGHTLTIGDWMVVTGKEGEIT